MSKIILGRIIGIETGKSSSETFRYGIREVSSLRL